MKLGKFARPPYVYYEAGAVAIVGIYLLRKRKGSAPTGNGTQDVAGLNGNQTQQYGPGYPFVTGNGTITCLDGTIVNDPSQCPGGTGAKKQCGTNGLQCCANSVCNDGTSCVNNICTASQTTCGGLNQSCCKGNLCNGGLTCQNKLCLQPQVCGGSGQPCCAGTSCSGGLICTAGVCVGCGTIGQSCCAGSLCVSGTCINGTCQQCGDHGNQCCPGNTCKFGLTCHNGTCLTPQGNSGACGTSSAPCPPKGNSITATCSCVDGATVPAFLNNNNCPPGTGQADVVCSNNCQNLNHCTTYSAPFKPGAGAARTAGAVSPFGATH